MCLVGGAKHLSGSKGNILVVNVVAVPAAMVYPALSSGHLAGLPWGCTGEHTGSGAEAGGDTSSSE